MSRSISFFERFAEPRFGLAAATVLALALLTGCNPSDLNPHDIEVAKTLSLAALPALPADPTNRVADNERAAAFGATLFFDPAMSANGEVSCSTCHKIDRQFQDDLARGHAIGDTDRRTMPLAGVAYSPWQFWDGRRDSLWAQALTPMEDEREHGGNRTAYARTIAERYRDRYEGIFGPLPDLADLPENAGPRGTEIEQQAWSAIPRERQTAINTVFANIGKAIAAFERTIMPPQTHFDRFVAALSEGRVPNGDAAFSDLEREGLKIFIGSGGCIKCHNGPRFTDDQFHNTGVRPAPGLPEDHGRAQGIPDVLADPFNCLGRYSDGAPGDCDELRFTVRRGPQVERAFKTPSLRGVAARPPYMHTGQLATLDDVIDHYREAPDPPSGQNEINALHFTERARLALIAFLKTLDE